MSNSLFFGLWGYSLTDCENWNGVWITFFYNYVRGGRFSFVLWNIWDIVEVVFDRFLSVSEILVPPKVQG